MKGLKQSTVATVIIGPVLDSTGAAVTSAVVGDFRLAKNGSVATLSGATVTHDANGYYTIALTTGNTDTTGRLVITSGNTAHSMASHHWSVLPASVFDAIYTNATNTTGGLATATGAISALAGAIATTTNITSASGITLAATTHTGAVIPTVTSVTNGVTVTTNNDKTGYTATVSDKTGFSLVAGTGLGNQTANITGNLSGSVGSVTGSVGSVTSGVTVSDKTGFKLASDGLASISSWTVAITGNITGNLSGSVGSISGVTFPAHFGSLGIDPSGSILTVGTVDELGGNALTANQAGDPIAGIVWNALLSSYTVNGSFGARLVRSTNSSNEVQLTGGPNPHISASVHAVENGAITSAAFAANWFTAAGLASDAVSEIADGVWDEATSGHTTAGTTGKALIDAGSAGNPWSTDISTGYSGTQAGNILNSVKTQTDLIQSGGMVYVTSPVTASGQLTSPLVIGDDYLAANGRKFRWTVPLPSGYVIATSSCKFGMRFEDTLGVNSFVATGTVSDAGSGNVYLDFDVPRSTTGTLRPGWYDWSVEIVSATGVEITRVKSGKNAQWVEKQT